jgi:hypothetical protein
MRPRTKPRTSNARLATGERAEVSECAGKSVLLHVSLNVPGILGTLRLCWIGPGKVNEGETRVSECRGVRVLLHVVFYESYECDQFDECD